MIHEVINEINETSGFLMVVVTLALAFITYIYVRHTKRLADHSRQQVEMMMLTSKISFHREMCERVYIPLKRLLSPLSVHTRLLDLFFYNYPDGEVARIVEKYRGIPYGISRWQSIKKDMHYFIYQLDEEYSKRLLKINSLFDDYWEGRGQFQDELDRTVLSVWKGMFDSNTDWEHVRSIKIANDVFLIDLKELLVFRGLIEVRRDEAAFDRFRALAGDLDAFMEEVKKREELYWGIRMNTKPEKYVVISFKHEADLPWVIRHGVIDEFVREVGERIRVDKQLVERIASVRLISSETSKLIQDLETEIGRNEKSIGEKYNSFVHNR